MGNQNTQPTQAMVEFHGTKILTVEKDGQVFVAIRQIVEALGLDWKTQRDKLKSKGWGHILLPFVTQGGTQELLCLPLRRLNGWLFSVNPNKIKAELRQTVIAYQDECFEVLYAYWHRGAAVNPRATEEQLQALQSQIDEMQAHIRRLGLVDAFFGNRTPFGIPSRVTGNPRVNPVRGYLKSNRKAVSQIANGLVQLCLNLNLGGEK